jgi:hypothetical protein
MYIPPIGGNKMASTQRKRSDPSHILHQVKEQNSSYGERLRDVIIRVECTCMAGR